MSNDENTSGLITNNTIDEPLIIVLDEDDDDELEEDFDSLLTTIVTDTEEEEEEGEVIQVENSLKPSSNPKSKVFNRSNDSSHQSVKLNKPIRTILIDTSFIQPSNHQQRRGKRKIPPPTPLSIDSVLSYITFDKVPDILAVSRMGSVYYCIEDLYVKIFSSLCTLDEFTNLLSKSLKQVTLSEKISITQQNPRLKKFNHIRYRLIPIDSSDYLLKLKHLLITTKNKKRIEKIIEKMRSYKQTSTSNILHDKTPKKDVSIECNKHLKNVTNKQKSNDTSSLEIVIECDLYSKDKTDALNHNLTKCSTSSIEKINPLIRTSLHRSKSLIFNSEQIRNRLARSYSLPSIKFNITDHIMLKVESIDSLDDNYSMPMIVNVEENVQINNPIISSTLDPKQSSSSNSDPFPYLHQTSSCYLTPIRTPYDLYYPEPVSSSYKKSKESFPIIMSLLEKPIYHRLVTSEKPIPDCSSCCSRQSSTLKTIPPNERMIHQQYEAKSPVLLHRKQHRMAPYSRTKTYFAPLSIHHHPINETAQNSSTTVSPPKGLKALRIQAQSIDLSRAIIEHNNCDMDKIPKLVVRHTKTYRKKNIDTMGQLFPTWFNEPDYRCIHCFNCDRVFTPQLFMTHVDDKQMINEQPLNMTSIELLTSEKMSEYKVGLWNQFCTNLTNYAREDRIIGFYTNKSRSTTELMDILCVLD